MHVILTHEQADFDAMASQLGAFLLQEDVFAVLPKALNRNVRDFLHLYAADLPFIAAKNLPSESINAVTLVDTQSLITIKGLKKKTQIFVIDHHKKKKNLPPDWKFNQMKVELAPRFLSNNLSKRTTTHLASLKQHYFYWVFMKTPVL